MQTMLALWCSQAAAAPRDPMDYAELAPSLVTAAAITVNTSATPPTMTIPVIGTYNGFVDGAGAAVFTFGDVDITGLTATGTRPLVILSRGDLDVRGSLRVDANGTTSTGPGGHLGRTGSGGAGTGPGGGDNRGGGAGHGAAGGASGDGGSGGPAYGNLLTGLDGGSGGGRSSEANSGDGGAGGGALELGARRVLTLTATASIDASAGGGGNGSEDGGGGGSGGAVLLNGKLGSACAAGATIDLRGGGGGAGSNDDGGGGGAGGRILFYGIPSTNCTVQLNGGSGGSSDNNPGDNDGANGGNGNSVSSNPDNDGDGTPYASDCDDENPAVEAPSAEITGDGIDQDCDGRERCYVDDDDDGASLATDFLSADADCLDPNEGQSTDLLDCDDTDDTRHPGAAEQIGSGVDEDCDSVEICYVDGDDDGARLNTTVSAPDGDCADANEALATDPPDCVDTDDTIRPGATELAGDSIDQNCDTDELCFVDADDDGARLTTTLLSTDTDCTDPFEGLFTDQIDCVDNQAAIRPGATEVAGDNIDQNCDTDELCYIDDDDDGTRLSTTRLSTDTDCTDAREGLFGDQLDCDDTDAAIRPGATEGVADGVDQNCDTDELCYADADDDGARLASTTLSGDLDCTDAFEGVFTDPVDCDDTDPAVRPGVAELPGDNVDQNCDTDELCYVDGDNDGARTNGTVLSSNTTCNDANEAVTGDPPDCVDTDPAIKPGVPELPGDNVDQDCDTDELCYADADDDGARHATNTVTSTDTDCTDAFEGVTGDDPDCVDTNAAIRPGATELPGDGVDQNCDTDELCYTDADDDGARLGTTVASSDTDCTDAFEGVTGDDPDCVDTDAAIKPGVPEVPGDEVDQNCDGGELCYTDADDDGARLTTTVTSLDADCDDAFEAVSADDTDCVDNNAAIRPGATELPGDNVDQNCDNDELCYTDADNDGARLETTVFSGDVDCDGPNEGRTGDLPDCDDTVAAIQPGAAELPGDNVDQNCDLVEDCFTDDDDDGARTGVRLVGGTNDDADCDDANEGRSADPTDCDDAAPTVHPGAAEVTCNGLDDDCSAGTPDNLDADSDGSGQCQDCDDADPDNFPGNPEVCDSRDNDCEFGPDNGLVFETWYVDLDLDTFGDPDDATVTCDGPPADTVADGTDCDDTLFSVNPDATEIECNGLDDDCDRLTTDGPDLDSDTYSGCGGDCNDLDPDVNPGTPELLCNLVDDDCEPSTFDDADADGDTFLVCSDGDCADNDPDIYPGAVELACNAVDDDCDPGTDDDPDLDGDGFAGCADDCDDDDDTTFPGAPEVLCDQVDNDCERSTPDDQDRDGDGVFACQGDCDDGDPDVRPGVDEIACNDVDDDCDPDTVECPAETAETGAETGETGDPPVKDGVGPPGDAGCACAETRPGGAWPALAGLLLLARRRRAA